METDPPAHYFRLPHENDLYIISLLLALIVLILPHTEAIVLHAQRAITAEHTTHSSFILLVLLWPGAPAATASQTEKSQSAHAHICVLGVPVRFCPRVPPG